MLLFHQQVARSFESLTPTIIIILGMSTITMWLGIDVHSIVGTLIKPLVNATDTLPSTLIIIFLIMFFWSFGIHGDSIVSSLARPIWLILFRPKYSCGSCWKSSNTYWC